MRSRRTLILVAAIVTGTIAAVVLWGYVSGLEDRAYADADLVPVLVVDHDIPKGTPAEAALADHIVEDQAPAEFRPGTALTDVSALQGKVALADLSAGQVVVEGMFVDPRVATTSFSQRIPAGQVAITQTFGGDAGVAGLLVPGDKVNMIVTNPSTGDTQLLFQNVNILAIGQSAAPEAGDTQPVANPGSSQITFAVPPDAAEKLVRIGSTAVLTLVPPDNQPVPIPPINDDNLFSGGLTPYPEQG